MLININTRADLLASIHDLPKEGMIGAFMNEKQIAFGSAPQKDKTFVGGIGSGKTTVLGAEILHDVNLMPRSHGFLLGNTYKQIITNFLPSLRATWERIGVKENIHYVIGKTPPKSWPRPYIASENFENSISFQNGCQMSFMAADRRDMNRGSSYQWGKIDEAGLIKEEVYRNIIAGRIRGALEYFHKCYRYGSISRVTSMPFLASGMWVLKFEERQMADPNNYFYIESKTIDNIQALGEDYIKRLEELMDPLTFAREVNNQRFTNLANGFYPQLNERHLYSGYEYDEGNSQSLYEIKIKDSDTDEKLPLAISIDFGSNFNCMSVWQYHEDLHEERCINAFHVNKPYQLNDLIDVFCDYYKYKLSKDVEVWGDRNGIKSEVNDNRGLFEQVMERLQRNGFTPRLCYNGWENPLHKVKYEFLNDMLREETRELPRVRYSKDKALAVYQSMMNSPIKENFRKDKSQEKLGNDPNRYLATDYGDTSDYYLFPRWHPSLRANDKLLQSLFG